jgi:hypothetical protein
MNDYRCQFPCSSEPLRLCTLRRTTVVGEVPQPGVHRRELRFEIGDRPPDVRRRFPELALVLARALAQGGDRDRDPADTMLKALALELSPQCVGGGGSCGAHRCGARSVRGLSLRPAGWTAPLGCRLRPARSSSPQETQPTAKVTVAHLKAVV